VLTELHFAMDARTSAPSRVGCYLMPSLDRYEVSWLEGEEQAYVALRVPDQHAETLKQRICQLHPTVRLMTARPES
jgi:hypothetical protein